MARFKIESELVTSFENIEVRNFSGVLLDLDDTLYVYQPCHKAALFACYEYCNFDISFEAFSLSYRTARTAVTERLHPQGACRSRLFAFMTLTEEANLSSGYEIAFKLDQIYWSNFIAEMKPHTGAEAFLQRCFEHSIPTCVVTDMTAHIQIRKLSKLGLTEYVSKLVTSEEVGAEKPDARMFLTAASKLNVPVNSCIMIGDNLAKDIDGAISAGMTAHLIKLEG